MSRPLFLRKLRKYVAAIPALAFGFVASPAFSTVVTINASGFTAGTTTRQLHGRDRDEHAAASFTKATSVGINPTPYIGVSGGFVANEFDGTQRVHDQLQRERRRVSEITLGMLFSQRPGGRRRRTKRPRLQTIGGTTARPASRSASSPPDGSLAGLDHRRHEPLAGHRGQRRHLQDHESLRLGR